MSKFSFLVISSVLLCSGCGFRIETGSDTAQTTPIIHAASGEATYDGSPTIFRWANEFQTAEDTGNLRTLIDDMDLLESFDLDQLPHFMNPSDHDLIQKTAQEWLGDDGVIAQKHLTPKGNQIRQLIVGQLTSTAASPNGKDIRRELNRALLFLGSPHSAVAQNHNQVSMIWEAIRFILQADSDTGIEDLALMRARMVLNNIE